MKLSQLLAAALLATPLVCQANAIPGTNINIYEVGSPTVYGRIGPAYPNGTAGIVIGHSMSNCGSVHIPWDGVVGSTMQDQHVKIAFLLAREEADGSRMVQISGKSHCKHSRTAFNFSGSPPCFPCQSGPSGHFRIGCYDIYSTGFNGNRAYLGPTTEINPWLGTWNPTGSYFDIGDRSQANFPQPADNVQSLDTSGWDPVKNRMEVREQELIQPGTFYGQNQVVIIGEPVANRDDNLVSRGTTFSWNGSSWSAGLSGGSVHGSVLTRWTGATTSMGGNGGDDGRFLVAVKVTGPTNGMWHYEYAIQNVDNHRGGASFRLPVCPTARVENVGFRDIDGSVLNDWDVNRTSSSLEFLAAAGNALDWNTFYNVWFDSDAAPVAGVAHIDEARPGPGALTVDVTTTVPGFLGTEHLGAGCGSTVPAIYANGSPSSPNPSYAVEVEVAPSAAVVLAFAAADDSVALGGGCTSFLDGNQLLVTELLMANGAGQASYSLPIPAGLAPIDFTAQAFEVVAGGAFLGFLDLSNGLKIRAGGAVCP